jgi:ribose 1,5-bisphosphokinase PhnN
MPDVRILNSWKEISSYVGRGVRTVQRWEELYGLPVHRAAGRDRSAVYALSDEIDAWLRMGKMHDAPNGVREVTPPAAERYRMLLENAHTLVERLRVLRQQSTEILDHLRRERENHVLRKDKERATPSSDGLRKIG